MRTNLISQFLVGNNIATIFILVCVSLNLNYKSVFFLYDVHFVKPESYRTQIRVLMYNNNIHPEF